MLCLVAHAATGSSFSFCFAKKKRNQKKKATGGIPPDPLLGTYLADTGSVCQLLRRGTYVNNFANLLSDVLSFQIPEAK